MNWQGFQNASLCRGEKTNDHTTMACFASITYFIYNFVHL